MKIPTLLLQKYVQFIRPHEPAYRMLYSGSYVLSKNLIMNKITNYVGIDISKNTFDVYNPIKGHEKYENTKQGFERFRKGLSPESYCVMEATGCYHHQLALYLNEKGVSVSVVNPLVIKRYIQMKLQHSKTDKMDAIMISQYAHDHQVTLWEPPPEYIEQCNNLSGTIGVYFKQRTALKNKEHSLKSRGGKDSSLLRSIKRQQKSLEREIKLLEEELEAVIKEHNQQMYSNLASIPGIGKKTALLLIASTNEFKNFENHRQLSSYFGISPIERRSGSSIKGRSRISKSGNPKIRNHLFMCSFTACECNPQCRALYQRMLNKGKSKKLALVAVANKLLKQSFAIAKSGIPFDENYRSKLKFNG